MQIIRYEHNKKIVDKVKKKLTIYLHTNNLSNLNIMLRLLSGENNLLIRNSSENISQQNT